MIQKCPFCESENIGELIKFKKEVEFTNDYYCFECSNIIKGD